MTDTATMVTCSIDGKEITVPAGTLIIRAAEQLGIEIPRFCDHPLLEPVGACRQCYVEVEGQRKLFTSCTTPVAEGWVIKTQNTSEEAQASQVQNLEFLLINHPLDCPVCDRGGECPLQDQTMQFGPGASRFQEAKRTFEKPIPLSDLIALDRERCVLCARCTRFCDQISGDRFIDLHERGAEQQVQIAAGEDFASPFSGNTVQICPVGALTARTYRFAARPFDLHSEDTVCAHCSAGCNLRVDLRKGEVVRQLSRWNLDVNDEWACDKGRFAFRWVDSDNRLDMPLVRAGDVLQPAPFGEAFGRIATAAAGGRVAFLTGGRLADEDYYALSKLARTTCRTNDVDHRRVSAGLASEALAASGKGVTYADVEQAETIVVVGLDAEQEVPILHLRIRKAVSRHGARVIVIHPRETRLHDVAEHVLCAPGGEVAALKAMEGVAGEGTVVLAGARLGEASDQVLAWAKGAGARFAMVARRANDHGALRNGAHPALLPGGRRVDDPGERAEVEAVWGAIDDAPGRDARAILQAAADGEIAVLYLIGVDPLRDFPDAALAQRAIDNAACVVVQSTHRDLLADEADVMLPAVPFAERDGHFTDWEGRSQRLRAVRGGKRLARPDWELFASLAEAMGGDLGFGTLDELREEMAPLLVDRTSGVEPTAAEAGAAEAGLTLFTYPLLVDDGRLSEDAGELKATQGQPAFVHISASDAAAVGVADGDRVKVATAAGRAILPARVDDRIARGAVFVPFNQEGFAANTLLSGAFIAPVTLEGGA